jgi:hypothetical protein
MKYLSRAAQRLEARAAPAMRPAMPSRSPLAEADQRLNIDSFAERLEVPQAAPVETRPAARQSSVNLRSVVEPPVKRQDPPASAEGKQRPVQAAVERVVENSTAPQAPAERPLPAGPEPLHLPDSGGPGRRPLERAQPQAAEASPIAPTEHALQTSPPEPPPNVVIEAVTRALSWVEAGNRPSPAPEPPTTLPEFTRPRPLKAKRTRATRPSIADRPVTHLEIGKIEVEVVQPEKPTRVAAPGRPQRKATSNHNFGWRQR